jgi:succinate dehydrogenase/fumarate reductase flavoprotein subunit
MYWLTGYDTFGFCFFQCLVVKADGSMVLLTRSADLRQARHTSTIENIVLWTDRDGANPALDLRNLLTISEAVARAAIERRESRGGHFREDYPDKDPQFGTFNITLRKGSDGSMVLERLPIPPMPPELKAVIEEMK